MISTRVVVPFVLCFVLWLVLGAVACSSTSTGSESGTSGSGSSNNPVGQCGSTISGSSACTRMELETYDNCVLQKCDAQYKKCLGDSYQSGSFSGPCAGYYSCTNACSCTDSNCRGKCSIGAECQTCFSGFSACRQGCAVPTCASGGSSGSSGTSGGGGADCAALSACCARITDADKQNQCGSTRDAVFGNESACKAAYDAYRSSCP